MFDFSKYQEVELKRWRPFKATDFQSLMYPCFICSHILGIFPYKINASTFEMSKLRYILSTVVICVVCACGLMVFSDINISGETDFNHMSMTFENTCFYILHSFIIIITCILSGPRMRLLQTIMDVSSKLPLDTYKKLSKLIHAKDIFGFFFHLVILMLFYNKFIFNLVEELYTIYVSLVVFQMDMLYLNCVCILTACFKNINNNLVNLQEAVVKDVPHLFSQTYQRNLFLLMEIKILKKQHLIISDTVQMLNLAFSMQLFATMVITFFEITFTLYFYISEWPDFIKGLKDFQNWSFLLYVIIYQILKIFLIVWACEIGKNRALEIGTNIHVVSNSINDEKVKNELQLFSLQILHCKNIFSTKGFNINATLVTTGRCNIFDRYDVICMT
ncbi:uncharacterized protein LOC105830685 isoform X2 [Monomorium pharaonis]|uniref:uncharacterized protein LOC105830685 isoform X2 n=1 Tax=Monomorium pharaonis TaxID=307658 RepID=UPI001745D620|nr:uncharacterized protein LOC105830685 isoform X2 [Monomorium pharaonis]